MYFIIINTHTIKAVFDLIILVHVAVSYMSFKQRNCLWTCALYEDSNQPVHPQSDQTALSRHEETLHPWLSKMRPVKIQIRLRIRAV